ncbi:MAG: geranylgeranyl reductase family protein [Candidatus Aenigmatarchaeota archaeon]
MYDLVVVGGSLSGLRVAELVARKNHKVLVIEEHNKIGFPSKCTGLVSYRIKELLPFLDERIIQNEVKVAKFVFGKKHFEIESKKPMYVLDRVKLDKYLYQRALSLGVEVKLDEKFLTTEKFTNSLRIITDKNFYDTKMLVGADGAFSAVAKNFNLYEDREFFVGVQGNVEGKFEKEKVELWFGSNIAKDFFAWVVPINENIAKIGLATKENPFEYYKKFLRKRVKKFVHPDTSGIIKFGLIKKSVAERVLLVGDAAMQVKPFSGGGIIYSLIASELASLAILKSLAKNDFSEEFLKKSYEEEWKRKLAFPIIKGLILRKLFYAFGDLSISFWFNLIPYMRFLIENLDVDFY